MVELCRGARWDLGGTLPGPWWNPGGAWARPGSQGAEPPGPPPGEASSTLLPGPASATPPRLVPSGSVPMGWASLNGWGAPARGARAAGAARSTCRDCLQGRDFYREPRPAGGAEGAVLAERGLRKALRRRGALAAFGGWWRTSAAGRRACVLVDPPLRPASLCAQVRMGEWVLCAWVCGTCVAAPSLVQPYPGSTWWTGTV